MEIKIEDNSGVINIAKDNAKIDSIQNKFKFEEEKTKSDVKKLLKSLIVRNQNKYVKKSYDEHNCFTWKDLDKFKANNIPIEISNTISKSEQFNSIVDILKPLSNKKQEEILYEGANIYRPTWEEFGRINIEGQTEAGQETEKIIAATIVDSIRNALIEVKTD